MSTWKEWMGWAGPLILGMPAPFLVCGALDALIVVKKKLWLRLLLLASCWVVSFNVIFIGDWVNISFGMALFLGSVWLSCEGSGQKRMTLGLIFASTVTAFNGFYDNCLDTLIGYHPGSLGHNLLYCLSRVLFAFALYHVARRDPSVDGRIPYDLRVHQHASSYHVARRDPSTDGRIPYDLRVHQHASIFHMS